jgi:MraZ protein
VALGFFGRYEHSLDQKGRLILPARFRGEFDASAYITQHSEGCLAMWTPAEFEKQMTEKLAVQDRSPEDRNQVRVWAGTSAAVEIDRQGRVAVPAPLREFAGLDRAVLVMGAIDRIELWDPQAWEAEVRPSETSYRQRTRGAAGSETGATTAPGATTGDGA